MNRKPRFIIFLCFFLFSFTFINAQEAHFVFSHLDVNDGLSDNRIKCIIRDRNGFLWFGTSTGLNRYDGYEFETYLKSNSDSATLSDNDVNNIAEDHDGNLWIGSRMGISVLDVNTYRFRRINLIGLAKSGCQDVNYVTALTSDSEGNIWIGTHSGLFFYNRITGAIEHFMLDEQSCSSLFNSITALSHDIEGSVWIGTVNGYIFKYNISSSSIEKLESLRFRSSTGNPISRLFADKDGILWVADSYGLYQFDIRARTWIHEKQELLDSNFSNLQITEINQDNEGTIWVATDGKGLFLIDKHKFIITNLKNRPFSDGGLSSDGLLSLYIDKSGTSWIGTTKKGVDFYKKNIRKFQLIRSYPAEKNSLSNNDVNSVVEDSKGNLWIGTNGGGLNYYDPVRNSFRVYTSSPGNSGGLSNNFIVSVFEDSEHKIWAGTFLGGLNRFDPETGRFTVYRHNRSDSTSISDNSVWGICEDSKHNLWFATLTNGLNLFDRATGKFRRYRSENSSLCFNYLNSVIADKNDNLWISSSNGLIFFNPRQNISVCYTNNPNNNSSVSDNHISSVFEDSRGFFWVCTGNGLNLMDRKNSSFRALYQSDGLPSPCVLRVLEDKNHDLWISTKNGISKLTVGQTDRYNSLSFYFKNYTISDGLQGKEYNETAAAASSKGILYFGGPDGLNSFDPAEIAEDTIATKLVFTRLRVFNNIISPGEKYNKRILLEKPLFNTNEIKLRHRENSFTIDFAALNYFYPERTEYSYMLEGFNKSWITTEGRKNFANYSNLNQGKYRFRLRGTNSSGIWNSGEIVLKIRVMPPLWKSWFAYMFYVLIGTSLLVLLRVFTVKRERTKMKIEQERIEARHTHEIDSLKLKFFTNISHEFRTPLTLILTPVENLLHTWKGRPEEKNLMMIRQNARRLLLMVNQLLDFRKLELQGFRYSPSFGDIIAFLKEMVDSFTDLSEKKHIDLRFSSEINTLETSFDKDKLEKIMFNLLSNAFKFVGENGRVSVNVRLIHPVNGNSSEDDPEESSVVIDVEDNGIGIPSDKLQDLFTRSYNIETPGLTEQGNGIGLSLVHEFVKLHDGAITVRSEPGKGSTFTVTIPVRENGSNAERDEKASLEDNALITLSVSDSRLPDLKETRGRKAYSGDSGYTDVPVQENGKPIILIAEDNDDLRSYMMENLVKKYHIIEAANGSDALKKIRKTMPDLIISDIMMPGLNGIELCKKVKNDKTLSHIPLILLTARYTEEQQIEGIEAGADDYITKPFNFQILVSKIDNSVKVRKNIQQLFKSKLNIEPSTIDITSLDEQFLQKAIAIVEKNIAVADFTVEELSREMGMSRTLLYKKTLTLTGRSPVEFIRLLRLKRAALLLQKSQLNVSEITFRVGFKDPKYFRKHFLREFGVLPSKFSEGTKKTDTEHS
jgi:ligand-binding sensor domain-containing protein/signal transduction histidine kinase/DNA-binding response OmpR family regulator